MSMSTCKHEGNAPGAKFCRHCGGATQIAPPPQALRPGTAPGYDDDTIGINKCGFCSLVAKKLDAKFCAGCGAQMIRPGGTLPPPTPPPATSLSPAALSQAMLPTQTVSPKDSVGPKPPLAPPSPHLANTSPAPIGNTQLTTPKSAGGTVAPGIAVVAPRRESEGEMSSVTSFHHNQASLFPSYTTPPTLPTNPSAVVMPIASQIVVGEGFSPSMLQSDNISELTGWRTGAVLGKGSFGTVYLGMLRNGTIVAVKQIHIIGEEFEALAREVGTMRCLRHPNISRFLGCEYRDQAINIFMEFVSGGSLADLIKKFKPLPIEVITSYTRQILTALEYVHSNNIIHRDIKADNILVETSTNVARDAVVKLVDFGTSKHLGGTLQKCKTFVGTPYWMAPEVLTSADGYTFKADLWSVGCTVCEMISGKPPWPEKSNIHQAVMMIGSGTVPMEIPQGIPDSLKEFLDACFQREPEMRPTATELLKFRFVA